LASLEIFHKAGIEKIRTKSEELTSYLEDLLENELEDKIEIITSKSREDRGCQLSLQLKDTFPKIMEKLHQNGILADWREPDVIRVAPVPLYNSFEDCFQFVERIKKIVRG